MWHWAAPQISPKFLNQLSPDELAELGYEYIEGPHNDAPQVPPFGLTDESGHSVGVLIIDHAIRAPASNILTWLAGTYANRFCWQLTSVTGKGSLVVFMPSTSYASAVRGRTLPKLSFGTLELSFPPIPDR